MLGNTKISFVFALFFLIQSLPAVADSISGGPRAILFDVMGTCVEVTSSLAADGERWGKEHQIKGHWEQFAEAWVNDHVETIGQIVEGKLPWLSTDTIHRRALPGLIDSVLRPDRPLSRFDLEEINQFWTLLNPWPDTDQGLRLLHETAGLVAFTNADTRLLEAMSEFAGLTWNKLVSADEIHFYKPDPRFYAYAEEKLRLKPDEVLLVAAHPYDLRAAKAMGWRTAFIKRPGEYDPRDAENASTEFDFVAPDFVDLARQLSARYR